MSLGNVILELHNYDQIELGNSNRRYLIWLKEVWNENRKLPVD